MGITGYQILQSAEKYSGVPYSEGKQGKPPAGDGYDCSGIVQQAMSDLGVKISRTTSSQLADANAHVVGVNIGTDKKQAQVGDIIHYLGHEEIWATTPTQKGTPQVFSEATNGTVAAIRNETPWPVIGIVRYATDGAGPPTAGANQGTDQGAVSGQLADLVPGVSSIVDAVSSMVKLFSFVLDPKNLWRVALAGFGAVLLMISLVRLTGSEKIIASGSTVAKIMEKVPE